MGIFDHPQVPLKPVKSARRSQSAKLTQEAAIRSFNRLAVAKYKKGTNCEICTPQNLSSTFWNIF